MGKQLVNIVGVVVVVAIVVAGTLLIGLPMLSQSFATGAQAALVDQTNLVYSAQLTSLQKEKENIGALSAEVKALQAQIPATNKQDDVFELVASAATATGVVVKSVTAGEPVDWAVRAAATDAGTPPVVAADGSATGAGADGSSSASTDSATPAPSPSPTTDSSNESGDATTPPAASPQSQIPFIIVVQSTDAAATTAFIDALGKGPRLLGIVHGTLTKQDTGYFELTVNALAFVRTAK